LGVLSCKGILSNWRRHAYFLIILNDLLTVGPSTLIMYTPLLKEDRSSIYNCRKSNGYDFK